MTGQKAIGSGSIRRSKTTKAQSHQDFSSLCLGG
jgi:hypothetical protein